MRPTLQNLLLAVFMAITLVLAVPVPMSDDEIQARWKRGDSEVCCSPSGAGCYVLAWWRSLSVRNGVCLLCDFITIRGPLQITQEIELFK